MWEAVPEKLEVTGLAAAQLTAVSVVKSLAPFESHGWTLAPRRLSDRRNRTASTEPMDPVMTTSIVLPSRDCDIEFTCRSDEVTWSLLWERIIDV